MDLPLELQLGILKYLNKRDHKVVRLVNKDWSAITSGFLFDRIYWSPQDRDLEVFKAIATHPELAQCVKELIFDGSQFVDGLTKRTYLEALCSQHDLVDHRAEFVKVSAVLVCSIKPRCLSTQFIWLTELISSLYQYNY